MNIKSILNLSHKIYKHKELINKQNVNKVIKYLKQGELIRALVRIDSKINAVEYVKYNRSFSYINDCLEEYSEDNNIGNVIVDIIIPIYNAYEYTVKCIESVYKNTNSPYNLYLINDCSIDDKIDELLNKLDMEEKPSFMKKMVVIKNENNLGFIRTVNKAVELSSNHVVLLNTDTEVPTGWLSRLIRPIIYNSNIASVTPFSNCATICSFPNFCEDNILPEGISLNDLDLLFKKYGSSNTIEIPTGVGFCMALNRACINKIGMFDTVYGKGYGEENDWCCRAVKNGFVNVMITNLFVYHKHGASFGEIITKSKQERIDENLKILCDRHPEYTKIIDNFCIKDPAKDIRNFLKIIVHRNINKSKKAELIINHSLGGGATTYVKRKIEKEKNTKNHFVCSLLPDNKTFRLESYIDDDQIAVNFNYNNINVNFIKELCSILIVDKIFINQLIGYPLTEIIEMICTSNIQYDYFVHDFFCVCPRYNLLNDDYKYCNDETDANICNDCIRNVIKSNDISDIVIWRKLFYNLLINANSVIAPSMNTVKIINKYYPDLKIKVMEHAIPKHLFNTYENRKCNSDVFHISVLGAILIEKGSKILYEIVKEIKVRKLPIKITVIGYTDIHNDYYISKDKRFEVTGLYENKNISSLLSFYKTDIVMIPSIWPETYSYTTDEAIASGYKVVAFKIGAHSDRIIKKNMGWIVEKIEAKAMMEKILTIINQERGKYE